MKKAAAALFNAMDLNTLVTQVYTRTAKLLEPGNPLPPFSLPELPPLYLAIKEASIPGQTDPDLNRFTGGLREFDAALSCG